MIPNAPWVLLALIGVVGLRITTVGEPNLLRRIVSAMAILFGVAEVAANVTYGWRHARRQARRCPGNRTGGR